MGVFFFITNNHYKNTIEENQAWLSDNAASVVLSRQISQLDQLATEVSHRKSLHIDLNAEVNG